MRNWNKGLLAGGVAMAILNLVPVAWAADAAAGGNGAGVKVTPTYASAGDTQQQESRPAPDKKSLSYAIGLTTARNLVKDGTEVDMDFLAKGLHDGFDGKMTMLDETQVRDLMNDLVTSMRQRYVVKRKAEGEANRKKGEEFSTKFSKLDHVRLLPSGVLIQEIETGKGPIATLNDSVKVNYRGTLVDGKEFDATAPGKPATFGVSRVIPGWREALALMPVGSHWKVVVPPDLAYGERGIGTGIGPNETLVFDMTLLDVVKAGQ